MTTGEREGVADDIDEAIEYQKAHTRVPIVSPNQPADYKPPTPITEIDPLANIPSEGVMMTQEDKIRSIVSAAEKLIETLGHKKSLLVRDIIPYLPQVVRREMNAEDVALAIKVERTTAWRWLKRIDPSLVKPRRPAVNPDDIDTPTAIAVYIDFAYNGLTRLALSEKYDLPDKAVQALIARGRTAHGQRLSEHHKNTKDAAG